MSMPVIDTRPVGGERHEAVVAAARRAGELMGVINVAFAEALQVIGGVIAEQAWGGPGIRSVEHWICWTFGVSAARARRWAAIARRLDDLPCCAALVAEGQLTEDQTAVIFARTPTVRDAQIAELAPKLLVSQLRRLLATMPEPVTHPDPDPAPAPERREVRFGNHDNGQWWCRMQLPPDEGAKVEAALRRGRDREFQLRHPDRDPAHSASVDWADGLVHAVDAALAAMADDQPNRPLRHQVIVHVAWDSLGDRLAGHVQAGVPLPDALRRMLTCDADVRALLEAQGVPVALSSPARVVNDRLRAIIEDRDRGCRVPGCTQTRWLHIHHLRHWDNGGPTTVTNLCCLCPHHHRLHHLGLLAITGDPTRPDGLVFTDRHGHTLTPNPPRPPNRPPPAPTYHQPWGERLNLHWVTWN